MSYCEFQKNNNQNLFTFQLQAYRYINNKVATIISAIAFTYSVKGNVIIVFGVVYHYCIHAHDNNNTKLFAGSPSRTLIRYILGL